MMAHSFRKRLLHRLPDTRVGWLSLGVLILLVIVSAGAVAGSILYPVGGLLLGMDLSLREMLRYGMADGAFYALIWAPGISIVLCIIGIVEKRRNRTGIDP